MPLGELADDLVRRVGPKRVLDVDCTQGGLVQALRDRGVETYGLCVSGHALTQVPSVVRPYCWVGAVAEPLAQDYDLITCFDVTALGTDGQEQVAVANLCAHTQALLFSCAESALELHADGGLQSWVDWLKLLGEFSFSPDMDFAASLYTRRRSCCAARIRARRIYTVLHNSDFV